MFVFSFPRIITLEGDVSLIESAHGDFFRVVGPVPVAAAGAGAGAGAGPGGAGRSVEHRPTATAATEVRLSTPTEVKSTDMFDACASWWTQVWA